MTATDDLRAAMHGVNMSQLARDTGIARTELHHFRAGRQNIRLDKAEKIAAALGLRLHLSSTAPR